MVEKEKFKSESEFKLRMGIGSLFLPLFARKCLFFFLTFVLSLALLDRDL